MKPAFDKLKQKLGDAHTDRYTATSFFYFVTIISTFILLFFSDIDLQEGYSRLIEYIASTALVLLLCLGYLLHRLRWRYSAQALIVFVALIVGSVLSEPADEAPALVIIFPSIFAALVATKKSAVLWSYGLVLAVLAVRTGGDSFYFHFTALITAGMGVIGLYLSRALLEVSEKGVYKERDQLLQITEKMTEVFYLVDAVNNEVLYISPAVKKIWGSEPFVYIGPRENMLGQILDEDKQAVLGAVDKTINDRHDTVVSYRIRNSTGSIRYINDRMFPIVENNKVTRYAGVAEDETLERELEKAEKSFMVLASHHLRTPLTVIRNALELVTSGDLGKIPNVANKHLKEAMISVTQANGLVHKLLDIARVESGSLAISPEPINLEELMNGVLQEQRKNIDQKHLKTHVKVSSVPPIVADRNLVSVICSNLVSNAVLYSKDKQKITISLSKHDQNVRISVKDMGVGIPKSEQERVFTQFWRASNVQELGPLGQGLGLFLCQKIVDLLGGTLRFTSNENAGSEFIVELPVQSHLQKAGEPLAEYELNA